jgi:hypothetical protein
MTSEKNPDNLIFEQKIQVPCSEPPTTTSNKNLAHWVQYLISPLPAKAEGD